MLIISNKQIKLSKLFIFNLSYEHSITNQFFIYLFFFDIIVYFVILKIEQNMFY
jgi:hypothetical protein